MNYYQKFYTNQIHSSSLLCQLATMWKSQVLCDAIIRSGSVVTKAHRVVLVAACPMLQSMENAAVGSHLEVRLAADIKQDSIQTFLQYLYEGFMMLTEQNCRDVEKIARLLQVDNVIKCCADFNKCLNTKTGQMSANDQYKYTFHDMVEFKHVRSSEMQKTVQERSTKRTSEFPRPPSPGSKRQRTQDMHTDDAASMSSSYSHVAPDPWDRVPKLGMPFHARGGQGSQQLGVVDVVEDSLELIQTDPPDSSGGRAAKDQRSLQKSVSIAVASQLSNNTDLQIVDVATEQARQEPRPRNSLPIQTRTAPTNQTHIATESVKSTNSHSAPKPSSHPSTPIMNDKLQVNTSPVMSPSSSHFSNRSSPQVRPESSTHKPFAAGSESQSSLPAQQSTDLPTNVSVSESMPDTGAREMPEVNQQKPPKPLSPDKPNTDLSIVKIESDDDEEANALEMYINVSGGGGESIRVQRAEHNEAEEGDPQAEWMREDMSNEDSNVSGDQSNSWMYPAGSQQQYKGFVREKASHGGSRTSNERFPIEHSNSFDLYNIQRLAASAVELGSVQHRLVRNEEYKYKVCYQCHKDKTKTKKGWRVYTHFKCEQCSIPLCTGGRGTRRCFEIFHREHGISNIMTEYDPRMMFKYDKLYHHSLDEMR